MGDDRHFLLGAAIMNNGGVEEVRPDGLVTGHAYSVIQVKKVSGYKMVQLRNPWGNEHEWKGRCSDHDSNWWSQNPGIKKQLNWGSRTSNKKDGLFWMPFDDFVSIFDYVAICPKAMCDERTSYERFSRGGC